MEPLADPLGDRCVKDFEPPPPLPLKESLLYPQGPKENPDWRILKQHLFREGKMTKEMILDLIKKVVNITSQEPNLLRLKDPITVVGDIHGQFYDLLKLLNVGGDPDTTQYLFLGDYVDRGSFSIEALMLLFALKLNQPQRVHMLRGNHECRQMTAFFNFRDECDYKHDMAVYQAFMDAFDSFPLAAVINGKFLALHGGISPDFRLLSQVKSIERFQEPPRAGLFCDLLWADPVDEEKEEHRGNKEAFFPNDVRGCSFFFGYDAAAAFLDRNGLLSVIRAHEAQLEGFKMHQANTKTGFPTVITIFSAPNYCDCYNNKGAVLKFENNTLNIQQFNFSAHPYHLPNFMDVFTWSIPFVSEKVTEMLCAIIDPSLKDDEEDGDIELPPEVLRITRLSVGAADAEIAKLNAGITNAIAGSEVATAPATGLTLSSQRKDALRNKVKAVARLLRFYQTLRKEHELVVQLKGMTPGHRIPPGALLQGKEGLKTELQKFSDVKSIDRINERRPNS
eukprot:GHVU01212076.1.p1 GENE.GHVU01212076.1~~GHVU01212076.1.p1  ORF type:complete len:508 (+),score=108.41 GHVU01212076.1:110-1633(+)